MKKKKILKKKVAVKDWQCMECGFLMTLKQAENISKKFSGGTQKLLQTFIELL
jgi:hypothetical protein